MSMTTQEIQATMERSLAELEEQARCLRDAIAALSNGNANGNSMTLVWETNAHSARSSAGAAVAVKASRGASSKQRHVGTRDQVLAHLHREHPKTASAIVQETGLGRGSVSTTLSKLARAGQIKRHPSLPGYVKP